jgi:hypothetical protein
MRPSTGSAFTLEEALLLSLGDESWSTIFEVLATARVHRADPDLSMLEVKSMLILLEADGIVERKPASTLSPTEWRLGPVIKARRG